MRVRGTTPSVPFLRRIVHPPIAGGLTVSPAAKPTIFVVLSFEGPDTYSRAGGLGARVTELTEALARSGQETHLFFIGDPSLPPAEVRVSGELHLHRWCQWLSAGYPDGVYDGEEAKLFDWNQSLAPWLERELIGPALRSGKNVVVMAEEWQTTAAVIALGQAVETNGWEDRVHLFWNANHFFGFDRIDWDALAAVAAITTVSRYMKQIVDRNGVEARVIPNGISEDWFAPVDAAAKRQLEALFADRLSLVKVARWDPDKGWMTAIGALSELKRRELQPVLIARGGNELHGSDVLAKAKAEGLKVGTVSSFGPTAMDLAQALRAVGDCDLILLQPFLNLPQRRLLFGTAHAVLANSRMEPFGLVGLETMARGGIAVVGSTGEDYATPGHDSVAIETDDPNELADKLAYLKDAPEEARLLRQAARRGARRYTWPAVIARRLLPVLGLARGGPRHSSTRRGRLYGSLKPVLPLVGELHLSAIAG
jgi:glycosyltransferase involved in cell wall biosynthesis